MRYVSVLRHAVWRILYIWISHTRKLLSQTPSSSSLEIIDNIIVCIRYLCCKWVAYTPPSSSLVRFLFTRIHLTQTAIKYYVLSFLLLIFRLYILSPFVHRFSSYSVTSCTQFEPSSGGLHDFEWCRVARIFPSKKYEITFYSLNPHYRTKSKVQLLSPIYLIFASAIVKINWRFWLIQ